MTHEKRVSLNTTWVTPKWVRDWLGRFDLDPASFKGHPWPFATKQYFERGLERRWSGRVFLNPPYEWRQLVPFMAKMAQHDCGVALVAARVETVWFQDYVFGAAQAVFFPRGRIKFCTPNGTIRTRVGFPACLAFYEQPPVSDLPGHWWHAPSKRKLT